MASRKPSALLALALALAAALGLLSLAETRQRLRIAASSAWESAAKIGAFGDLAEAVVNVVDDEDDDDQEDRGKDDEPDDEPGNNDEPGEVNGTQDAADGDLADFADERLSFPCGKDAECRETTYCDFEIGKCRPAVWRSERADDASRCAPCRDHIKAILGVEDDKIRFVADLVDKDSEACMSRFVLGGESQELDALVARADPSAGPVRRFHHHLSFTLAHCPKPGAEDAAAARKDATIGVAAHSGRSYPQLYTSPHFLVARKKANTEWLSHGFYDGFTSELCQFGPFDTPTACMVPVASAEASAAFLLYALNNWEQLPEWIAFFDADNGDKSVFQAKLGCLRVEPNMEIMEVIGFMPLDDTHQRARKPMDAELRRELTSVWRSIVVAHLGAKVPQALPKVLSATRAFIVEAGHVTRLPRALFEDLYLVALGLHADVKVSHPDLFPALWSSLLATAEEKSARPAKKRPSGAKQEKRTSPPPTSYYDCVDDTIVTVPPRRLL